MNLLSVSLKYSDSLRNIVYGRFLQGDWRFCERARSGHFDRISASSHVENVPGPKMTCGLMTVFLTQAELV